MPETFLFLLADGNDVDHLGYVLDELQKSGFAFPLEDVLELQVMIEVILNDALVTVGDEDDIDETGALCFLNHILDDGFVVDGQHLFGDVFGSREGSGAPSCDGDDNFAYRFHGSVPWSRGYTKAWRISPSAVLRLKERLLSWGFGGAATASADG